MVDKAFLVGVDDLRELKLAGTALLHAHDVPRPGPAGTDEYFEWAWKEVA